jgi:hypothetical protein
VLRVQGIGRVLGDTDAYRELCTYPGPLRAARDVARPVVAQYVGARAAEADDDALLWALLGICIAHGGSYAGEDGSAIEGV